VTFAKQVTAFVAKAEKQTDEQFGKEVLALYGDIVRGTPVDTGVLQNNWQFGANTSNGNKLEEKTKNKGATIAREQSKILALKITQTGVIFNNMEYADAVENGIDGTRRVPARMVARAIVAAQARRKA
jgi:hypothetical protein